ARFQTTYWKLFLGEWGATCRGLGLRATLGVGENREATESPAASITRCRPQARPCRLPAMSGEMRGKTPRPKVKGNCAVPLALRRRNSMKTPQAVRTKKSQGAGAVSVAGFPARLSPPLSRSRHHPFLAVSGTLTLIYSDDVNPMLLTIKDFFQPSA